MKNFLNKFKWFILGGSIVIAGTVYGVQISVPSSNGPGFLLQSLSSGLYSTVSLIAGSNITISTTTSSITISSTASGSGTGNVATSTNEITNRLPLWTSTSGSPATLGQVGSGTNGQVLAMSGGIPTWVASTTYGSGYATTSASYLTHSTTTTAFDGVTFGMNIVPTAGALTWTPTFSGNFNGLSHDSSFTGTTYNLSATVSDWGLALNHTNTWSVLQNFNYSSSTIYSSFITASTTNLFAGNLTLSTTTVGCLNTNSAGVVYSATCSAGGGVTSVIAGAGFQNQGLNITSSGTLVGAFASSSVPTISNIPFVTGTGDSTNPIKLGFLATTSVTCSSPLSCTSFDVLKNGGAISLSIPLTVAQGGTNKTSYPGNSIITSDTAGTSLIATGSQLTIGSLLATSSNTNILLNTFTGFGTTSPFGQVQISTTSINAGFRPQLVLTDQNATSTNAGHWYESSMAGKFELGTTSSGGTYATSSALAVSAPTTASPNTTLGIGSSTPYATLSIGDTAGQDSFAIGSTTTYFKVDKSGAVYAPNTSVSGANQTGYWCYDGNGQFIRDTTTCLVSALKFKTNIKPLDIGLPELLKVQPVTYYFKDQTFGTREQIGVIADQVAKIDTRLIGYDSNGDIHNFNYEQFTAWITKAIQDFYKEFQILVARVSGLEKRVNDLEAQNAKLQSEIDLINEKIK